MCSVSPLTRGFFFLRDHRLLARLSASSSPPLLCNTSAPLRSPPASSSSSFLFLSFSSPSLSPSAAACAFVSFPCFDITLFPRPPPPQAPQLLLSPLFHCFSSFFFVSSFSIIYYYYTLLACGSTAYLVPVAVRARALGQQRAPLVQPAIMCRHPQASMLHGGVLRLRPVSSARCPGYGHRPAHARRSTGCTGWPGTSVAILVPASSSAAGSLQLDRSISDMKHLSND